MENVGHVLFLLAIGVGAAAAGAYILGLFRMLVVAVQKGKAHRPMWLNYAALTFGLAVPVMIVGLVLWQRLDWWFLLIFAPFVVGRLALFGAGRSISRRS